MSAQHVGAPSEWVLRFAPIIPAGLVLDLACGSGRHSLALCAQGRAVRAVDRDPAVLAQLALSVASPQLETACLDLETPSAALDSLLAPVRYAGIVVTNYLHRPLLPKLLDSLIDGGVLIYETFAVGNAQFGRPSNPAFLLQYGELAQLCLATPQSMHLLAFEDGFVDAGNPAMLQRVCAVRRARARAAVDPDLSLAALRALRL